MSKNISRRSFLKGSALAASLAMIPGAASLAEEAPKTSPVENWDMAADFIVVGGGTGLAGAVAGAAEGMSVILIEKRPAVGGAMALSGGCAWLPNTKDSQANGDSFELAETYLKHMQQEYGNDEVMYAFLENTQNTVDTLQKGGVILSAFPYPIEYHNNWAGAGLGGGRTRMVIGENGDMSFGSGGARLNDALVKACESNGVKIITNLGGERLITTRESSDAVPKVIGLIAKDSDGKEYRIKANRGILLATGGFEWDTHLTMNFVRVPIRYCVSYPTNDGAALRMVQSVGAELSMMNEFWGQTVYTAHGEYSKKHGVPCCLAAQNERSVPGAILVDKNAQRFCDEASDYDSQGNTMGGYSNFGDHGWSADPCWLIYDDVCYTTYNLKGVGQDYNFPVPDIPEEEMVIKADTLEELAEKIGLNPQVLVQTVEQFNEGARNGVDPIYHRGEFVPISPVSETLAPLEKGPFRAISISNGTLGTKGGPKLNKHAQVMHVYGEPVSGLYAMGNCAGVGAPGPAYGGAGGTIGPAFVMGVLAAQHAAARTDVTDNDFYTVDVVVGEKIELNENEYIGTGNGIGGPVKVKVKIEEGKMTAIEVVEQNETVGIGDKAIEVIPQKILEAQNTDIEMVSGATVTSKAIIEAVKDALAQAGL